MLNKNIETFLGCDAEYEDASIVLFGAPFDSTVWQPGHSFRVLWTGDLQPLFKRGSPRSERIRQRRFGAADGKYKGDVGAD